jgi:hypothetical protein
MTSDPQPPGAGKRTADDVAADMQHRLEQLGEDVHDAERKAAALPENPLKGVAGDPEAIAEGPLSGGATLSAAESRHADDEADG